MSTPELLKKYPLILITGARHWAFFHSEHHQIPRSRALKPDPCVELHPDTAARYGISERDWVWIENPRGRCRQKAKLMPVVDPRVVAVDHGLVVSRKGMERAHTYGLEVQPKQFWIIC